MHEWVYFDLFRWGASQLSVSFFILVCLVLLLLAGVFWFFSANILTAKAIPPEEKIIRQTGRVTQAIQPGVKGKVKVLGEIWDATASVSLAHNTEVVVVGFDPHHVRTVQVVPLSDAPLAENISFPPPSEGV